MAPDAATKDGYTGKSGTSMATPLMAGIAALMVQANPDITPTEFKDIIAAHSIEREIALLDDPGFNDCSLLETRPDNEFGYGQADPVAFVEAAGSIDRSLNERARPICRRTVTGRPGESNSTLIQGLAIRRSMPDWLSQRIVSLRLMLAGLSSSTASQNQE